MRIILNLLIILGGTYLLLLAYLYFRQDAFIYFPTKIPPHNRHVLDQYQQSTINFTTTGATLQGWFIECGNPLIIYFGGNAEEVSGNLYDLNKYPSGSLLFVNYRGFGASTGRPTAKDLSADALVIYDTMISEYGYSPANIILIGRSLGSAIAVHLAANRDVKALVLISPFDSMVNLAKKHYPIFPVDRLLKHRFDSRKLAPELNIPMLAIIGEKDRIIPRECSLSLVKVWNGPNRVVTIPAAGHNDISIYSEYWQVINDFIAVQFDLKPGSN
ncbi:MAG: alpha/beta hydrolase [Candidatus Marinimicrobia bacterium]|nr:alpha/beta hydrolase [Candidatus Neomarinimicrobiota bacterium]